MSHQSHQSHQPMQSQYSGGFISSGMHIIVNIKVLFSCLVLDFCHLSGYLSCSSCRSGSPVTVDMKAISS